MSRITIARSGAQRHDHPDEKVFFALYDLDEPNPMLREVHFSVQWYPIDPVPGGYPSAPLADLPPFFWHVYLPPGTNPRRVVYTRSR